MGSVIDGLMEGVEVPDSDGFDRRRILVWGAFASALTSGGFLVHRLVIWPTPGVIHINVLVATLVLGSAPFVMRLTGSYSAAAHMLLAGLTAMVGVDCWLFGGIGAPAVFSVIVIPLMAAFYLGRWGSVGYALVQALMLVGLYGVTQAGWVRPPPEPAQMNLMLLVGGLGILGFLTAFSLIYEMERAASIARIAATVENLSDGVLTLDSNARVRAANHAAAELLGVQGHLHWRVRICPSWRRRRRVGASGLEHQVRISPRPGPPGRANGAGPGDPLSGSTTTLDGAVVIVRDITLQAEVDRMKTNFIATVSHELRTPMTSVLGFAKVIRNQLDKSVLPAVDPEHAKAKKAIPKIQQNLGIIVSEGERLTALINDVLDISKIDAGRMVWQMAPLPAGRLVQRAIDATSGLFAQGPVQLVAQISDDLPTVLVDENRMLQVLINLISNASKFTEEGSVRVEAERVRDGVRFVVVDTGSGIPKDQHVAIFDRFHQAKSEEERPGWHRIGPRDLQGDRPGSSRADRGRVRSGRIRVLGSTS